MERLTPGSVTITIMVIVALFLIYKALEWLIKKLAPVGTPGAATTMTWLKANVPTWYAKEQFRAAIGWGLIIFELLLFTQQLVWWFTGQHPKLLAGIVLLAFLGGVVLKKNWEKLFRRQWYVGLVIFLVGVTGAILEDHNKKENLTLDQAVLGGEQRQAAKEMLGDVKEYVPSMPREIIIPKISFAATTPNATPAPAAPEVYLVQPGQWTEVPMAPGRNNNWYHDGPVRIADRNGNVIFEGQYDPNFTSRALSRFWVTSLSGQTVRMTVTH